MSVVPSFPTGILARVGSPYEPGEFGVQLTSSLQFSFGTTKDIKLQPDLRMWFPLSRSPEVAFVVRTNLGFLFPSGFGQSLDTYFQEGDTRDQQYVYFRGLFSGGATSNRGYLAEWIAARAPASFLLPQLGLAEFRELCAWDAAAPACNMAVGGRAMWEGSTELQFPIYGPVSGSVFVDTSDVSPQRVIRFKYPHLSPGIGVRLDTSILAVKLAIAYRVPGLQRATGTGGPEEPDPGKILGVPITFNVGLEPPNPQRSASE